MDRALNLEAFAEEDGEESDASSPDEEWQTGEPNQFDSLCDGVLACVALVHASIEEMLELKDELLRHSLPPSVLTRAVLVTSKVFRSFSDMHVPIGELIRMVRLYSTPWEEKSTALKKLHDDYEGKKTQLNIAIRKLELIDADSKRIARERRVMNWEKLFAKLTAAKGHGRRWKFLIDAFKKRAGLGMEKLQEYLDSMDASSSEEDDEEEEDDGEIRTQMQHVRMQSLLNHRDEEEEDDVTTEPNSCSEDEYDEDKKPEPRLEVSFAPKEILPQADREQEIRRAVAAAASSKPPTKDAEMMAGGPDYDSELHIRVFEPEGLDCRELKCVLNLEDAVWKTGVLDMHYTEVTPVKDEAKPPTTPRRGGRGRGMIGSRGSRVSPSRTPTLQMTSLPEIEENPTIGPVGVEQRYFEESVFSLPEETSKGQYVPRGQPKVASPEHLRVAVHCGPREEMVAMATIHMTDLLDLELPTILLGPPIGDVFDAEKAMAETRERDEQPPRMLSSETAILEVERANAELGETRRECDGEAENQRPDPAKAMSRVPLYNAETEKLVNEQLRNRKPFEFPLYSIHAGKGDAAHMPCGKLPLLCFWVKREVPRKLSKITESQSVNSLVFQLTGIDLNVVTKDDLNKETRDEALSIISFTPEPPSEETVKRSEYNLLISTHNEEMEMMQNEYEQKLRELVDTVRHLQETQVELAELASRPQAVVGSESRVGSSVRSHSSRRAPSQKHTPEPATARQYSAVGPRETVNKHTETDPAMYLSHPSIQQPRVGKPLPKWGKNLSNDFFERLQHFENLSQQKRTELREHIMAGMRSDIERQMASQYRLAQKNEDGLFDAMQDVSLPAVFLPNKSVNMQIYNPRAHQYFHPTGDGGARLSQPPSILMLPPLPKSKMSVLNLFDMSQNFHRAGPDWLMQRYLSANRQQDQGTPEQQQEPSLPATAPLIQQQEQEQQQQLYQTSNSPPKSHSATHSQQPPPSPTRSRQNGSGSSGSKSRHSAASVKPWQPLAPATSPARHQVTLPGNTPPTVAPSPPRPGTKLSSAGSGGRRQQQTASVTSLAGSAGSGVGGGGAAAAVGGGDGMSTQSVSPAGYVPPRSAMTVSVTPGMLKSPNPVGQQEAGLVAPIPSMQLIESASPI